MHHWHGRIVLCAVTVPNRVPSPQGGMEAFLGRLYTTEEYAVYGSDPSPASSLYKPCPPNVTVCSIKSVTQTVAPAQARHQHTGEAYCGRRTGHHEGGYDPPGAAPSALPSKLLHVGSTHHLICIAMLMLNRKLVVELSATPKFVHMRGRC